MSHSFTQSYTSRFFAVPRDPRDPRKPGSPGATDSTPIAVPKWPGFATTRTRAAANSRAMENSQKSDSHRPAGQYDTENLTPQLKHENDEDQGVSAAASASQSQILSLPAGLDEAPTDVSELEKRINMLKSHRDQLLRRSTELSRKVNPVFNTDTIQPPALSESPRNASDSSSAPFNFPSFNPNFDTFEQRKHGAQAEAASRVSASIDMDADRESILTNLERLREEHKDNLAKLEGRYSKKYNQQKGEGDHESEGDGENAQEERERERMWGGRGAGTGTGRGREARHISRSTGVNVWSSVVDGESEVAGRRRVGRTRARNQNMNQRPKRRAPSPDAPVLLRVATNTQSRIVPANGDITATTTSVMVERLVKEKEKEKMKERGREQESLSSSFFDHKRRVSISLGEGNDYYEETSRKVRQDDDDELFNLNRNGVSGAGNMNMNVNRRSSITGSLKQWRMASSKSKKKITIPRPFNFEERDRGRGKSIAQRRYEEEVEQRKREEEQHMKTRFKAAPIPSSSILPMYSSIVQKNNDRRKTVREHSKELTQSMENPFSFYDRDREKWEKKMKVGRGRGKGKDVDDYAHAQSDGDGEFSISLSDESTDEKEKVKTKPFQAKPIPAEVLAPLYSSMAARERERKERKEFMKQERIRIREEHLRQLKQQEEKAEKERMAKLREEARQKHKRREIPDFERLQRSFEGKLSRLKESKNVTNPIGFGFSIDDENERERQRQKETRELRAELKALREKQAEREEEERRKKELREQRRRERERERESEDGEGESEFFVNVEGGKNTTRDFVAPRTTKAAEMRKIALERKRKEEEEDKIRKEEDLRRRAEMRRVARERMVGKLHDRSQEFERQNRERQRKFIENEKKKENDYHESLEEMQRKIDRRPFLFERPTYETEKKKAEEKFTRTLEDAGLDANMYLDEAELGFD